LKPELSAPFLALQEHARKIATISMECKIAMDAEAYVNSFKSELMPVVYAWSLGAKFSQICKLTEVFEGSIIRAIRRLDELVQQLITASHNIGNTELEEKFKKCILVTHTGSAAIKRDIVFANSLYL
jgi:ATP-dependent RNA helicase DOB1